MKISYKFRGFQLSMMLALVSPLLFGMFMRHTTAQQDNRQLNRDQTQQSNRASERRIALIIGNGAYTNAPPLKNPPNDARDMAATLKTLGFDVTSGINVNQRDMKRLIREFGQKLKDGGSGLFYYAGHGVQSKGRNYLIPIEADIQSEIEVEDAGVDVSLVLGFMDDAQNGLNIVILDACRDNPFARSFRSASGGLAQVDAPTGTLIAYATAPGRVASDGTGQNGLYTSELLKQMRVPGLSVTDMFMHVRAEVMKQTANKQVPWEASSLVGAFYFSSGPSLSNVAPNNAANESKTDPAAFELSYWETIKNSTDPGDFKSYLQKYPDGQFVDLAKNRLTAIETAARESDQRTAAQRQADEVARKTLTFKGSFGIKSSLGNVFENGTLNVAPDRITFVYDQGKYNNAGTTGVLSCAQFAPAVADGSSIREITFIIDKKAYKYRFNATSPAEATRALEAIRQVCAGK